MPVTYVIRFRVLPSKLETCLELLNGVLDVMRAEPNFHEAVLHRDPECSHHLMLYETWGSHEDVLTAQLQRPYRQAWHEVLPELLCEHGSPFAVTENLPTLISHASPEKSHHLHMVVKLSSFDATGEYLRASLSSGTQALPTRKINAMAPQETMQKTILLKRVSAGAAALACAAAVLISSLPRSLSAQDQGSTATLIAQGQQTFRFDTFGDEDFWGGVLKLHQVVAGSKFGGVGPGLSPKAALTVGLKVDFDALPQDVVGQLKAGAVNLDDPATTLALLHLNAVVGVTGIFEGDKLKSIGIQCAICHSTVDKSFTAPGIPAGNIGHRLDGWANRDINMGAIAAQSPDLSAVAGLLGVDQTTVRKVLNSWGPGKFDAEVFMDGQAFRPDGKPAATLIPPAFGLAGVNLNTWTGWGSVTYWNALVANLELHGKGRFRDPRLDDAIQFPIAAKNHFGNVNPDLDPDEDRITPKLAGLHAYQLSLAAPKMPAQPFNFPAKRGDQLFSGKAKCNTCHAEPLWTEPGMNMHKGADVCIDDFQANRSPARMYRTAPLGGLFTHQKGGFYHDGRFATLREAVDHYDGCMSLGLTDEEKGDLIAYLLTL